MILAYVCSTAEESMCSYYCCVSLVLSYRETKFLLVNLNICLLFVSRFSIGGVLYTANGTEYSNKTQKVACSECEKKHRRGAILSFCFVLKIGKFTSCWTKLGN